MDVQRNVFLKPRLVGARFENGALPVAVLEELIELREFIVEVARHRFKKANPERQRVPKGFADSFQLVLTSVEDGSAIPCLERVRSSSVLVQADDFDQARDDFLATVQAANDQRPQDAPLPPSLMQRFDRIGRTLTSGERMEFTTPALERPVMYTLDTRKRLIGWSGAKGYSADVELSGSVIGLHDLKGMFEIRLPGGLTCKARYQPAERQEVIQAVDNRWHVRCLIAAIGRYSETDELQEVMEVSSKVFFDAVDDEQRRRIDTRFDEIRDLGSGWFDGRGLAVSDQALDWARKLLLVILASDMDAVPYIFPLPDGTLRVEWLIHDWEVSVVIDGEEQTAALHALDHESDDEEFSNFHGDEFVVGETLSAFLTRLATPRRGQNG